MKTEKNIFYYSDIQLKDIVFPIDIESGKLFSSQVDFNAFVSSYIIKNNILNSFITIYTDGSYNSNRPATGIAAYSPELDFELNIAIAPECTIYTAENLALPEALEWIFNDRNLHHLVLTDSKSALEDILKNRITGSTNRYNIDLRSKIAQVMEKKRLSGGTLNIVWIPSHIGIGGNEHVDKLAKNITNNVPDGNYKIPCQDLCKFRSNIIKVRHNNVQTMGSNILKGNYYFKYYNKNNFKIWFREFKRPRKFIVTINRLRSNHYNLNYSLFRKNLINTSACDCGNAVQDINHILFQYPNFDNFRLDLMDNLIKSKIYPPYSFESIAYNMSPNVLDLIYKFLCDTKLNI